MAGRSLYEPTRIDFMEHMADGRISYAEFNLHHLLRCMARESHIPGCVMTSATHLAAETGEKKKAMQRLLAKLDDKGYIRRFVDETPRGKYPILIDKYETWDGTHALRVDAGATRDWREPKLRRVTHSGTHRGTHRGTHGGTHPLTERAPHSVLSTHNSGVSAPARELDDQEVRQEQREFDEFFAAYPKQVKPYPAHKAWIDTAEIRPPFDELMAALEAQKKSGQVAADKHTPDPANWLKNGQWEDQIIDQGDGGGNDEDYSKYDKGIVSGGAA